MAHNSTRRTIYVFADWAGLGSPKLLGELHSELLRGKEVFSFAYDEQWLRSDVALYLDPDLERYSGLHFLGDEKANFGLFLDSAPDRWGRVLMRRREAASARKEGRNPSPLFETDYLLGVFDGHRIGGLRFKRSPDGAFLDDNSAMAAPPWTSIQTLERVALQLEREESVDDPEYLKWLEMLVAPGASLGGARPKASVVDERGQLWIAKFPSSHDETDVGAWEAVASELARAAGVTMSESRAQKFSSRHHSFLTRRFDRTQDCRRLHFSSAMTMLGHVDGHEGSSYLEIVDFLTSHGCAPQADLEQLWRRIVFNMCVSNTDDHLRNHGFIYSDQGWRLAPAYDLNPVAFASGLSLNVSESDNALDLDLALEVAKHFRISDSRAQEVKEEVAAAARQWASIAKKYGISRGECALMEPAFRVAFT